MITMLQSGGRMLQSTGRRPPDPEAAIFGVPPFGEGSFSLLLVALALWGIALVLMHQGVAYQRWASADDETAPSPEAGLVGGWGLSVSVLALWFFRWTILSAASGAEEESFVAFISTLVYPPRDLIITVLVASIPPGMIALLKFFFAGSQAPSVKAGTEGGGRSPVAAFAGIGFALIQLVASILTIILFLRS